jgi:hypothetical protein
MMKGSRKRNRSSGSEARGEVGKQGSERRGLRLTSGGERTQSQAGAAVRLRRRRRRTRDSRQGGSRTIGSGTWATTSMAAPQNS